MTILSKLFGVLFAFILALINLTVYSAEIDTALVHHHIRLVHEYRRSNPDTAYLLGHKAIQEATKIDYEKGIADAKAALAYAYLSNYNKNDSAVFYYHLAAEDYEKLLDKQGLGRVEFGLGYAASFKGNLDESKKHFLTSLSHYSEVNDKQGMHNCYNTLSYIERQQKEYTKAFEYLYKAIELATEIEQMAVVADYYNNLGNIYKDQALHKQATDIYFEALAIWESLSDTAGMSIAFGSIGNMYYLQGNYGKALEYFQKKIPLALHFNNPWEASKTYHSMAKVYNVQQKYDTALICLKKALALNRSMNYAPAIADSYYNLAQTMFLMQKNESAQEYLDSCIYLAERYAVSKDLANYYLLQAEILLSKQANNSALSYLKKSYALAKEAQIPSSISDATRLLHSVYSASGNYEQAYSYLNEFKQMEDSLKTDENITEVTKLEMQYLFDKKEQQLKHEQEQQLLIRENKLKRQQVLLLALLIVMALTVALAIFIIRAINIKNKYRTLELEQKLLQVQMNPHFIFNSLCAIQNAMIENKTNEADLLLTKFARLIRTILENSRLPYVAVESEVETLQNYLDIQKIRFKTNFKYHIEIDEAINTESLAIPPMMAQPFIENAIEHGLLPKKEQGNINIQFAKKNGLIELIIEDNGVGRASMQENKPSYQEKHSLATVLTKERIRAMQKTVNKDAYFEIIDLRQNGHPSGTKVVFCLPYINTY